MPELVVERYRLADDQPASLAEARRFCRRLARGHYENFSVASFLLPRALRQHAYHIYAYCRVSDDLADEVADSATSLALLDQWRAQLRACYAGQARHPVFVALRETIAAFDLPIDPFERLLDAFVRDRRQARYATYSDLLSYCACSANPVGQLVLYLGGYRDAQRQGWSDSICTALQLANFWQDVRRDFAKGRVYLPQEDLERFDVSEEQLAAGRCDAAYRELIRFQVERTRGLFNAGMPLLEHLEHPWRRNVMLFVAGGQRMLDLIDSQGCDTLSRRPEIHPVGKIGLTLRVLLKGG